MKEPMFEQLTENARRVILCSWEEAERLKQSYIEPEHILLGLLRVKSGLVVEIFDSYTLDTQNLIKDLCGTENNEVTRKAFSLLSKRILQYASKEANLLDQDIDTEHLLLGLMCERSSKAFAVLSKHGLDYASLKKQIVKRMKRPKRLFTSIISVVLIWILIFLISFYFVKYF
jgi:ATP-dependent Clp protease ATP-binding subunit ClpC